MKTTQKLSELVLVVKEQGEKMVALKIERDRLKVSETQHAKAYELLMKEKADWKNKYLEANKELKLALATIHNLRNDIPDKKTFWEKLKDLFKWKN